MTPEAQSAASAQLQLPAQPGTAKGGQGGGGAWGPGFLLGLCPLFS